MLINEDKIWGVVQNNNFLEITLNSWVAPIKLRFYDTFFATCPNCWSGFKTEVAREIINRIKQNECGVCEDCEIKNFLEQNY